MRSGTKVGVGWLRRRNIVSLPVTIRTGHVKNDLHGFVFAGLGIELGVDCRKSAKELVGNVGENGGFASGDAISREKKKQAREEIIYGNRGAEFVEIGGEDSSGLSRLALILWEGGVAGAERGIEVGCKQAAAPAIGEVMGAANRVVDETGLRSLLGHFLSFWIG